MGFERELRAPASYTCPAGFLPGLPLGLSSCAVLFACWRKEKSSSVVLACEVAMHPYAAHKMSGPGRGELHRAYKEGMMRRSMAPYCFVSSAM